MRGLNRLNQSWKEEDMRDGIKEGEGDTDNLGKGGGWENVVE